MAGDFASGLLALVFIGIAVLYSRFLNKMEFTLYLLIGIFLILSRVFLRISLIGCFIMLGLTGLSLIILLVLIFNKKAR